MLEMSVNLTAPAVLSLVVGLYLIIGGLTSDILISESDVTIREEDLADAKATHFVAQLLPEPDSLPLFMDCICSSIEVMESETSDGCAVAINISRIIGRT
jgi:hypothetical protein